MFFCDPVVLEEKGESICQKRMEFVTFVALERRNLYARNRGRTDAWTPIWGRSKEGCDARNRTHGTPEDDSNVQELPPWITPEDLERRFRAMERLGIGRDGYPPKPGELTIVSKPVRGSKTPPLQPRTARTA
jgi:ribonucleotide reductase alpha subunit